MLFPAALSGLASPGTLPEAKLLPTQPESAAESTQTGLADVTKPEQKNNQLMYCKTATCPDQQGAQRQTRHHRKQTQREPTAELHGGWRAWTDEANRECNSGTGRSTPELQPAQKNAFSSHQRRQTIKCLGFEEKEIQILNQHHTTNKHTDSSAKDLF